MDAKKIGMIALAVVGIAAAGFSFKQFFMNEAPVAGADQAAAMRASKTKLLQEGTAGGTSGGTSTGMGGGNRPGMGRPGMGGPGGNGPR